MLSAACQIKGNLTSRARLPFYKGTILRAYFNRQFKSAACFYKKGRCDECRAVRMCDYAKCLEMSRRAFEYRKERVFFPPRPFLIDLPKKFPTEVLAYG